MEEGAAGGEDCLVGISEMRIAVDAADPNTFFVGLIVVSLPLS